MSILSHEEQPIAGLTGSPKTMFFLGLATGISTMSVLALLFVLSFLMKGQALAAWASDTGNIAAAPTAPKAPTAPTAPTDEPPSAPVPQVDDTDHILGNKNAKVTLIEYSDYECPFCLRHEDTIKQLLSTYKNDVRFVYRHYPLSFHPEAQKAAEAAECAGAQGKFWEMHDKIFQANAAGSMNIQRWKDAAKEIGLNADKFNKCLDGGEMAARVAQDLQEGAAAGVSGTPGTFVNGQLVEGAVPFATFKQLVEKAGAKS